MGTTADKLNHLINTKEGIRQELNRAYETEEISTSDTFDSYIQKLEEHPYYLKGLVEGTIENIKLSNITSIGNYAFSSCSSLANLNFPEVTRIGYNAFQGCSKLTEVSFPKATSTDSYTFYNCSSLASVSFPKATSVGGYSFYNCSSLTSISLPEATKLDVGAFYGCSGLTEVSIPNATIINQSAFNSCSSLASVSFPKATSIGNDVFQRCSSLTSVSLPKAKSIGEYAFYNCSSLTEVSFPVVTSIDGYALQYCSSLTTIYVGTNTSTVCTLSTSAFSGCTNLTNIYVPYLLVDSYKSATNWSSYADKIKAVEQPAECITLSITADDVVGNETSTTVHYTAECTYTKEGILQEGTMVFTGKATSDSFEQNTSTTDTVQRTVSFTFFGKTATATITQGVWINRSITVTTEGISSDGWVTADSTVDGYDVYMSNNKGKNSSQAVMKLECIGYADLTLYIRSNAESDYDYTIASIANASTYPTDSSSSGVKAHTKGNQNSGTSLSAYTEVKYTGLSDFDTIYIVFRKDRSGADGDDRGYVLIPKQA